MAKNPEQQRRQGRQESAARRRVREALRWLGSARHDPWRAACMPERHRRVLSALVSAAVAETDARESLGLSALRTFDYHGARFDVRYTCFQRLRLIDQGTGAELHSRYGVVR